MIINFGFGGGGGTPIEHDPAKLDVSVFNKYSQDQTVIDESQNESIEDLTQKIDNLQLYKVPNVTFIGMPTVNNGQISGFTNSDYAQFPFLVDFHNQAFEINMCFTTGDSVLYQHNIFDSVDGLAFAVRNKKFVIAMSSDGQTWDMGEHTGTTNIHTNTTYYVKFSWNSLVYKLQVSTDGVNYIDDITVVNTGSLFAKQIIIGKAVDNSNVFNGSINLNKCSLSIMGLVVWQGMDDAGISTRLATDLSNIDSAGVEALKEQSGANYIYKEVFGTQSFEPLVGEYNDRSVAQDGVYAVNSAYCSYVFDITQYPNSIVHVKTSANSRYRAVAGVLQQLVGTVMNLDDLKLTSEVKEYNIDLSLYPGAKYVAVTAVAGDMSECSIYISKKGLREMIDETNTEVEALGKKWYGTEAEYEAIVDKDPDTEYNIYEE